MSSTILYATTNPGKLMEVGKYLEPHGITLVSPAQLGIAVEVEESGPLRLGSAASGGARPTAGSRTPLAHPTVARGAGSPPKPRCRVGWAVTRPSPSPEPD